MRDFGGRPRGRLAADLGDSLSKRCPCGHERRRQAEPESSSGSESAARAAAMSGFRNASLLLMPSSLATPTVTFSRARRKSHLVRHERAELGETEIVAVGFVEHVLRGVEGVDDEAIGGGHEADMLQAGKADTRICDVVASWIEDRRLEHRIAERPIANCTETKSTPIDCRRTGASPPNIVSALEIEAPTVGCDGSSPRSAENARYRVQKGGFGRAEQSARGVRGRS